MSEQQSSSERIRQTDLRQLLFHVNNVFHTWVNLLLVAQSIFFAAIASLWGKGDLFIEIIVCLLGITMTVMLWYANATLKRRTDYLTKALKKVDPVYKGYMDVRPLKPVSVTFLLTHVLPSVLLVAWILVIYQLVLSP